MLNEQKANFSQTNCQSNYERKQINANLRNIMVRLSLSKTLLYVAVLGAISLQSCNKIFGGGGFKETGEVGELTGVLERDGWQQTIPYGMTLVPSGTFHMGQADEDITSSKINMNKQITIGGFYMDETEITNNEYRQFMNAYLGDGSGAEVVFQIQVLSGTQIV